MLCCVVHEDRYEVKDLEGVTPKQWLRLRGFDGPPPGIEDFLNDTSPAFTTKYFTPVEVRNAFTNRAYHFWALDGVPLNDETMRLAGMGLAEIERQSLSERRDKLLAEFAGRFKSNWLQEQLLMFDRKISSLSVKGANIFDFGDF